MIVLANIKRLIIVIIMVTVVGCTSLGTESRYPEPVHQVPSAPRPNSIHSLPNSETNHDDDKSDDDTEIAHSGKNNPDLSAPELSPEDYEQGFCIDDIYAQYLTRQFGVQSPAKSVSQVKLPSKAKRSSKRGKRKQRIRQNDQIFAALSYARDHMNGKVAPYFGAIPVVVNDDVDYWVQYFKSAGRQQFMKWLVRGESLRKLVQPVLQDHGIPIEFFYLAMIESGFNHGAKSRARAEGTWQFMKGTAVLYGLKINHWVDERRDPVKLTIAAATFLKDLYADVGDWYLAMAAYNAGPGRVHSALKRSGQSDFWALAQMHQLPEETKQYVPKVLAAILLSSQAKIHGFDVQLNAQDEMPEAEVLVKRSIRIDELAEKLGLSVKSIRAWNPELVRDITPPTSGGYALRLPAVYAMAWSDVERQLEHIDISDVRTHVVKRGDTLSKIARTYEVSIKAILAANPGLKPSRLRLGDAITIPIPGIQANRQALTEAKTHRRS